MRIVAFVSCLLLLFTALKYPENPPPAHTGGFGEPSCHTCHFDGGVNEGDGRLILSGLAEGYDAGTSHTVEVLLAKEEMMRAGLQLSARYANGSNAGVQAGTFVMIDDRLTIDTENNIQYVRHTKPGTNLSENGKARWAMRWDAPETFDRGDTVVFHLAANASNGDDSEFGDFIYLEEVMVKVHP